MILVLNPTTTPAKEPGTVLENGAIEWSGTAKPSNMPAPVLHESEDGWSHIKSPVPPLTPAQEEAFKKKRAKPTWNRIYAVAAYLHHHPKASTREVHKALGRYGHTMIAEDVKILRNTLK